MVELATPWALACLPLPFFVWYVVPRKIIQPRHAVIVPFFDVLLQQRRNLQTELNNPPLWLMLAWALLVLAVAGPRWVGDAKPLAHEGHNIMLALDISGSMAITDMNINHRAIARIQVVKHTAKMFVNERVGDKIGLLLFGTRAYLQTPLTSDRHSVIMRIDDASVGLAGKSTSLGDPIALAIKHLQHTPKQGRLIILLTDGASNSGTIPPLKAADLARAEGIKIHTIGLGSESAMNPMSGFYYPGGAGLDLDEGTLKTIASTTGGHYFRATDHASLQAIYALINRMETVAQEQRSTRPLREYYPWPLALAFIILLCGVWHHIMPLQWRTRP